MKIRYAITCICKETGFRKLAHANQGRYHFDKKEDAEEMLRNILKNNCEATLKSVYGDITKMRVDPVECYDHGDAIRYYFED
jgi:hypothetical protein